MKLSSLFKRGMNLVRLGNAARQLRHSADADKHAWARHYLLELLGNSRGVPTKVAQFMTMGSGDAADREILNNSIPVMPLEEVREILEAEYAVSLDSIFSHLEEKGQAASLGQVHFGKLREGHEVAVKVQFPAIADAVEAEMNLLGWMPRVGPVAKWGFSLDGYRDAFWENLSEELNYTREKEHQIEYRKRVAPIWEVVVPEVYEKWCRPRVLVQEKETGFDLDKAETMVQTQRQTLGRVLLRHYFHMLFCHGFVHADPHPGNFAFRKLGGEDFALIVYDYGSILRVPDSMRLTLLRIILALQTHERLDPVACLSAIGFDPQKLQDLKQTLPALLNVLFEPFLCEAPYAIKDWRLSERFEQIVGEMKWWFRSAAPPRLIYLMRTIHGLAAMLERLDARLSWKFILDQVCSEIYEDARRIEIPSPAEDGLGFDGLARYLKIYVVKANGNKIQLTMPGRVADDLESVIDPPVMESIRRQKVDLKTIQDRVRKSGFVPQEMFTLKDEERDVRVWLE
ncbi:MAG: hypothetical protein COV67_03680 [Nitrospinae bacterium CG11_big_fil_rev_8_21_14_0_20_56_8]|nr:MAG: hypothetical protein COV67_03680 [Nitrospinae bacterium CG11_big_fil_rev_8_21_14_0_20_56_8]